MKTSQTGIELIKRFEGFRSNAYKCPAGVWTIGYGFTTDVKKGDKISLQQADKRLVSELGYYECVIEKHVKVPLNQSQFDALVSLVFNIGEGAFKKSTLLKLLNAGEYDAIPAQFLRWNKAGGKIMAGLTRRRQAEADLFTSSGDVADMPQAVDSPEKPLTQSRTVAGAGIAGVATVAQEAATQIEPLVPYADTLKIVFVALALVGVAITIYARWDDARKGR